MDEPRLTVAGAARRLGIAPGTLRTWDRRYGVGPSDHARGRHRRYSAADVARLEAMQRALVDGVSPAEAARYARAVARPDPATVAAPPPTTGSDPSHRRPGRTTRWPDPGAGIDVISSLGAPAPERHGPAATGAGTAARGLVRAALALDAAGARRLVEESIARSGPGVTWEEVVGPALDAVEARVRRAGRGVEVARLLAECATVVFHVHASAAPAALPVRPVLLAGMPGDAHGVPLAALGALLAERRVGCRSFGPALPAPALTAAVRRVAPPAVVLWSQLAATADVAVVGALPVTRPRSRTCVAGPGWDGVALPRDVDRFASLTDAADRLAAALR